MELRHLRYFSVLAEELHFGRAAARLHLSQPPLSRQIRDLERELEVTLFDRTRKSVALTEPGKVFLESVRKVEEVLRKGIEDSRLATRGEIGHLSIGYLGAATYHVLPTLLGRFRKRYPDIALSLYGMMTPEQIDAIQHGTIDIGIMRPEPTMEGLESTLVYREPFVVALPQGHPLCERKAVHIRDLAAEAFVMLPPVPERDLYRQVNGFCRQYGFEPRIRQTANDTCSIVGLVGAGIGLSILPVTAQRMNISGVQFRRLTGIAGCAETVVVWRDGDVRPVVLRFLDMLRNTKVTTTPAPTTRG